MEFINGYPESMRESIKNVEKTRQSRLGTKFTPLTLDERHALLSKFHPDYHAKGKRSLGLGANKGEVIINEVADLLEANPLISEKDVDLSKIDYDVDVLILGGGGAGTVAALWAFNSGIKEDKMLITTKLRHGDSNSMMAQGGIQAADRPKDDPAQHYLDTYGGGHFANKPEHN
jgi:succinate dehydrogenase / fumarate reductase flavoprotein subunit